MTRCVSGVGTWEWAGTLFKRQWEACDANGSSCATISGAKGATYVVKPADLGKRLRVRIDVDSNGDNKKPDPIEVFSPLSAVVTTPPPPPVVADPTPQGGGDAAARSRSPSRSRNPSRSRSRRPTRPPRRSAARPWPRARSSSSRSPSRPS